MPNRSWIAGVVSGAAALLGVGYGLIATATAGPRELAGLVLCAAAPMLLARPSAHPSGPAAQTRVGATISAATAGWAFLLLNGREASTTAATVAVGVALVGEAESAVLLALAPLTVARSAAQSRRWWRLFLLACVPLALMAVVAAAFALQAVGTANATASMETVGWMAAAAACVPPAASLELWHVSRSRLVVGVAALLVPTLITGLIDPIDGFRLVSLGAAATLLGIAAVAATTKQPVANEPATRRYLGTLVGLTTLGSASSFAVLALLLLQRNA